MKSFTLFFALLFSLGNSYCQSVGIGTTTPHPSAKLEIASTTQGFLPPRMTLAQRNAIATPAEGLMIFCYECDELQIYTAGKWNNLVRDTACTISGQGIPICNQVWMKKNLDVATYRNGDIIPQITDPTAWSNLTTGAWCWYSNDSATYAATYSKLYNWYALNDVRGLAPIGWHIPTHAEWTTLGTCLGGDVIAGGKMKEMGTAHWPAPNTGATNSSGFTALAGNGRDYTGTFFTGGNAIFWSNTVYSGANIWYRYLTYSNTVLSAGPADKRVGFSVRCVRD